MKSNLLERVGGVLGTVQPAKAAVPGPRPLAIVREELAMVQHSVDSLAIRASESRDALAEAQRFYDAALQAYALGERHAEPSHGTVDTAAAKAAALQRLHATMREKIPALATELAAAELVAVLGGDREKLAALTAVAEAALVEFDQALAATKKAESALYELLFDQSTGLRQGFAYAQVQAEASIARHVLAHRITRMAVRFGFASNPRFETDGVVHLGDPEPVHFQGAAV